MQQKDRKQMYRQQTMGYFINAALEIIEEEGIDSLSNSENMQKKPAITVRLFIIIFQILKN